MTIQIGHNEVLDERKIATPSVFINREMFAGFFLERNPPGDESSL